MLVKRKRQSGDEVASLIKEKVRFACENTLRDKAIPPDKLLPGVTTPPAGAVEVCRAAGRVRRFQALDGHLGRMVAVS
ncbi:MAG TPA: hypothetical protein VM260_13960, partial [Pirellula sp.]|nr:hypothetical protein [Pirellula sp.]